jgi:serine protease Do
MSTLLRSWRWVVAGAWVWLVWGAVGPGFAWGQGEAEALSASFRKASQRVLPAVVTVRAVGVEIVINPLDPPGWRGPFGGPFRPPGPLPSREPMGSGVVIDAEKGFVLTNDHVLQGASRVLVILHDGRERMAAQVRRDPKSDLALLIIDGKGLTAADWGDSDALAVGDWVLAVGQPFGLSGTVTAGIISGKGRGIDEVQYEDLIQTDAAINPGNSGGPLVNLKGEIVGINTAIKTSGGGFEGVGFAVPASRARRVVADLAEHGRVRRAYLGIAINAVDAGTAERLERPGAVLITAVSRDSPAAEAGLRPGDVIVNLQGRPLRGVGALQSAIETAPVGQPLSLAIDRDGNPFSVEIRPRAMTETWDAPEEEIRVLPDRGGPSLESQPRAKAPESGGRDRDARGGRELEPLPPPEGSKVDPPR